jgi:adenosylcobinamide-GDP ribazoletransferase
MHILPLASENGLAALVGRPAQRTALFAIGLGAFICCISLGLSAGIGAIVLSGLGITATVMLARRMIGGYNGDTLGATQQVAETIILVGIAASFSTA